MTLTSLLLRSASVDRELDTLFKNSTTTAIPGPSKKDSTAAAKRKHGDGEEGKDALRLKRAKVVIAKEPVVSSKQKSSKEPKRPKINDSPGKPAKITKRKGKEAELDSDEDDIENNYQDSKSGQLPTNSSEGSSSDEDDDVPITLVHESLKKSTKKTKGSKVKCVPHTETPELRDQRTIFVGNLPIEVASKTPLKKSLQRHILSFVPTAKIESIRFRSIPFQTPTAKLPGSDDEGETAATKPATRPKKGPRTHEKERASAWRSKLDEKDEESVQKDDKKYLNPAQKKKIAFINQEFHSTADTINAYVVFAHAPNVESRSANLPPPPPTMDPYQAALSAAEACDGTLFMERMLRVDLVGKSKAGRVKQASDGAVKSSTLETDPRSSIFVGNLDFASKEEDLRIFFEGIVSAERGPPPVSREEGAEHELNKPSTWVTRVRIVRDKDTQLGKGFAYVQFSDRECVDELLALEEEKLKFAKRKLRVQRCKTVPGGKAPKKMWMAAPAVVVPKGDPALGEKLAGLPKDERKQLKSSDADRVARRLAKKKARMAMAPGVGKSKSKGKGKDRKRER